jgi:DNA polymerase III sliding clamp (beta) subunit (PCNA family)
MKIEVIDCEHPSGTQENEWTFTRAELAALLECASRDDSRVNLTQILLDSERGTAVATDGHRLLACKSASPSADVGAKKVPAATLANVLKMARSNHTIAIRPNCESAHVRVIDKHGRELAATNVVLSANHFPPWWQVVPKTPHGNPAAKIGLNGHYLAHVAKLADACDRKVGTIALYIGGALDPVVIKADAGDFSCEWTYVVMPMRL